MQKTPTLRPGQQRPKLSEILRRRSQTLNDFMVEVNLASDDHVQMHCLMHGIEKDITHVAATKKDDLLEPEKPAKKKAELKNALKELAKAEVKKMGPAEGD